MLRSSIEGYNLRILHIYFDGGLPTWKRETRFDRLHKDYLQRIVLRNQQADFELIYNDQAPFPAEDLLDSEFGYSKTNIDLVTPFLVPLIKESLQKSRFSERIEIVPGEADAWCAAFAREHSATVLTNDSDLAIYDLQEGQMIFLGSLRRDICELCATQCIMANVVRPAKVKQVLSAKDMMHAAFDLFNTNELHKENSHEIFAKKHSQKHNISTSSAITFEEFCSRYSEIGLQEVVHLRMTIQHLDPRLAEVIERLGQPPKEDVMSILPSLVEDPLKRSAWIVSESIREFTYSLLRYASRKDIVLVEYIEKGQPSGKGRVVGLLGKKSCIDACARLIEFLRMIRTSSENADRSAVYWRTVCSIHVCYYLLASKFLSPSGIRSQLSMVWDCVQPRASLSWSQIHFRGQMEATYYALRQLHQTLKYLELIGRLNKLHCLPALQQAMIDLPGIVSMFEESGSDSKQLIDIEYVIKIAREMLEG